MKKLIIHLLIVFLSYTFMHSPLSAVPDKAGILFAGEETASIQAVNIVVQEDTFYTKASVSGNFVLLGEVINTGTTTAVFVSIKINMYDAGNNLLGTGTTFIRGGVNVKISSGSWTNALRTGDIGFFELSTSVGYSDVDHYTYSTTYYTYSHTLANASLAFVGTPSTTNNSGKLKIDGTVKNNSSLYLTYNTKVFFAVYNSSGEVIDVNQAFIQGSTYNYGSGTTDSALEPGASGTFSLTMDAPYSEYSSYNYAFTWDEVLASTPVTYTLNVSSSPESGALITVSPNDIDGLGDGTTQFTRTYEEGSQVTLTAPAAYNGKTFTHWSVDSTQYSTQTVTVTMSQERTATAYYEEAAPATYTLTVQSSPDSGANISVTPNDNNGNGSGTTGFTRTYNSGTEVTLTAPAAHNGKTFAHWTVDSSQYSAQTVTVTMSQDRTATAYYEEAAPGTYTLTIQSSPDTGVDISVTPNDNNGNGSGPTNTTRIYDPGTVVTLTAPSSYNGNNFSSWTVDGTTHTTEMIQVTMNSNHTVIVYYLSPVAEYRELSVISYPDFGVPIQVSPADKYNRTDGVTDFHRLYRIGTVAVLTAPTSFNNISFSKWDIDSKYYEYSRTINVTMEDNITVKAVFESSVPPAAHHTLTVQSWPTNGVQITVSPGDINGYGDGTTAFTRTYNQGEHVTITAPASHNGEPLYKTAIDGQDFMWSSTHHLTMDRDHTVTVYYQQPGVRTLTVRSHPDNGAEIDVGTPDIHGLSNGTTEFTRDYYEGTSVALTAPATHNGESFFRWTVNDRDYDSRTVNVDIETQDLVALAIYGDYGQYMYSLSVKSTPDSGVNIKVSPNDINGKGNGTTSFSRYYEQETFVTVTAPAAFNGSNFSEWLVDGSDYSSRSLVIPVDGNRIAIAVYVSQPSVIAVNRRELYFCYILGGKMPRPQTFRISNHGGGTLDWSIADADNGNVRCSPGSGVNGAIVTVNVDPTGLSQGIHPSNLQITSPSATNSPQKVTVYVEVKTASQDLPPFGHFSTPYEGSTVMSSIPVTGWALDDTGVESVKIYRGEPGNLVYIGDAVFVEGARPDVERAYPGYPLNYKSGWGYMMLTNFLPNNGNGPFKLHAIATDTEGHQVTLGTKRITCDNANAVKPFGAIDTPTQGGTAFGSKFINWGWVLTPQPNYIPHDGSTINVFVDGINLGHPTYNLYRADIGNLFQGYANSDGAVGYFYLDTSAYENGVHTIQWTARDSSGNTDGIGSRFFIVQNDGNSQSKAQTGSSGNVVTDRKFFHTSQISNIPINDVKSIRIKRGVRDSSKSTVANIDDESGVFIIDIEELERLVIEFSRESAAIEGYTIVGNQLRSLPIGSNLDFKERKFHWQPGPGFVGYYRFVFIERSEDSQLKKISIIIRIEPKSAK